MNQNLSEKERSEINNAIAELTAFDSMNIYIARKPLSVNEAWQGKRFKTDKYKSFEKDCLFLLPRNKQINPERIAIQLDFSNKASDIDNPLKMILDILQKKYLFNDKNITELKIKKAIYPKGKEGIKIKFY
mgnify:FL=1